MHALGLLWLGTTDSGELMAASASGASRSERPVLQLRLAAATPRAVDESAAQLPASMPPLTELSEQHAVALEPVLTEVAEPPMQTVSTSVAEAEYFAREQLTVSPRPLAQIVIAWPPGLVFLGHRSAIFTLFIDEAGRVDKMVADSRSLTPAMEEVALQSFQQARFSPGLKDGLPVKSILRIEIEFEATLLREEAPQIVERRSL